MRMFRTIEGPPRRPARRWAFDALIAAAAAASVVPATLHLYSRLPGPLTTVLVLAAVPLLVRRTWPLAVFGCVAAASLATGLWDAFAPVNAAAMLVALYTVAVLRPRRDALACATVLEAVAVAAVIWIAGPAWWYDAIFLSGLTAAALGLGLYVATRRAYLAELHDRAERLERERDQQVTLAATAERARIAREMHDIVAHHLTVMVTLSDAAIAASAASPDLAAEVMRSVSATGRRALGDTRRLLGVLRRDSGHVPGNALQPLPGLAQLDSLIDQVRSAGLATTLETRGTVPRFPACWRASVAGTTPRWQAGCFQSTLGPPPLRRAESADSTGRDERQSGHLTSRSRTACGQTCRRPARRRRPRSRTGR